MKLNELDLEKELSKKKVLARHYKNVLAHVGGAEEYSSYYKDVSPKEIEQYDKAKEKQKEKPKFKHKGSGYYADVYNLPQKVNTVVKIGRVESGLTPSADSYLNYLHAIEDTDNPYFPQIYSVRMFKDLHGRVVYKVQMEKLQPLSSLNQAQTTAIGKRLIKQIDVDRDPLIKSYLDTTIRKVPTTGTVAALLGGVVTTPSLFNKDADAALVQAVKLLHNLIKTKRMSNDIGVNNVMWRPTPYGPQLVFSDPVA
ncbi:hypothetical protein E4H12_01870 [Candidatus Thorarchaeota archaeon]|nr:MAG: hypothetical protein E4H12_01870 [Candidatus Thorarchaeota archaeon]